MDYGCFFTSIFMKPIKIDFSIESKIKRELENASETNRDRIFYKIFGAALGSIPWIGGILNAATDLHADSQNKNNELYEQWLEEHRIKVELLGNTLNEIQRRLSEFPEEIDKRLESDEFLQIVRKSFKSWDNADSNEKRELVRKLLTNSGAYELVHDDIIRLFIDWINLYHDVHFAIIRCVYENPEITRFGIWQKLNGSTVKENSLEADLYKMLIHDLSTGGVIRQHRMTDYNGNFLKKTTRRPASNTYKSAFDNQETYELTEMGKQFVHYTMNEVVPRVN